MDILSLPEVLEQIPERERKVALELFRRHHVRQRSDNEGREQHAVDNRAPTDDGAPRGFSLNEFARLCVLLRDDERAHWALTSAICAELTRFPLDAIISRDLF